VSAMGELSRRERQIMEILFQRGKASAAEVRESMADAPSYSAVRAMLRILEDKGHVKHQAEGLKYVYVPSVARDKASHGNVFQRLAGAGRGRITGCLLHPAYGGGTGSNGATDRSRPQGGQVNG
jgi:predicted transcriptional regulator